MIDRTSVVNALSKPVFSISLDTELAWGFIAYPKDAMVNSNYRRYVLDRLYRDPKQGRGTIDFLLKLFEKYNIPATWGVVGHLFLGPDKENALIYREMPQFTEGWLNWDFYCSLKGNPLYHGRDIVEKILASPIEHEIGLHSFFHIPFSLCSRKVAEVEVELGIKAAKRFRVSPISFVMPGNRIGNVDVLKENKFQIYRGDRPRRWNENQMFLFRKVNGVIDKIIAPPVSPSYIDGIWELPSSIDFCDPQIPFSVLPRAKLGLSRAIRAHKVFHVSIHPWQLLLYKRLAKDLEDFLALVVQKRSEHKLEVMTLGELALCLNQRMRNI